MQCDNNRRTLTVKAELIIKNMPATFEEEYKNYEKKFIVARAHQSAIWYWSCHDTYIKALGVAIGMSNAFVIEYKSE